MTKPNEQDLLDAARRLLREQDVDELTIARLRAARLHALDAKPRRRIFTWPVISSVATAGMVAALAGILWVQTPLNVLSPRSDEMAVAADIDLLTMKENPEFYNELEFYDWLASEADAS